MSQKELSLSSLAPNKGARKRRKRLGIGEGSGSGKTSGKGTKGQNARVGCKRVPGFEGGQMPLHRRLPKFGFTSRKKVSGVNVYSPLSIDRLVALNAEEITIELLRANGIISKNTKVKILASKTELSKKIVVEAHAVSASARETIEKAGGQIKLVSQ